MTDRGRGRVYGLRHADRPFERLGAPRHASARRRPGHPGRARGPARRHAQAQAPLRVGLDGVLDRRSRRRVGRRDRVRRDARGRDRLRRALLRPDLRGDRRPPPLLLAPHLRDEPGLPVHPRVLRPDERAARRALVGRASPRAPSLLGQRARPALGPPGRATRIGSASRTSRSIPSCAG